MCSMVAARTQSNPFTADEPELDEYYTAFYQVEAPPGASATCAWQGSLQPYRSDEDARNLLIPLERASSISCDQGFISCGTEKSEPAATHWAKPFLVSMAQRFEVLILERPEPMHPVAFSLRPEISWYRFPGHPHLRTDIPLQYAGRTLHALCVYSAADFAYSRSAPQAVQFVDQVAAHLGRHLIWERTRRLEDFAGHILYQPKPGEQILDTEPQLQPRESLPFLKHPKRHPERVWRGHWPGKSAPAGAQRHLATIKPSHECWCGSGKRYMLCHLESELALCA